MIIIQDDNGHNNNDYYSDPTVPDDYDQEGEKGNIAIINDETASDRVFGRYSFI